MALLALACATSSASGPAPAPCAGLPQMLLNSSFVVVTQPAAGQRVASGFEIAGCSRTFESNVQWTLRGEDGREIARGHTLGGGVDGAGPFRTTVAFALDTPEIGSLEVVEPDPSGGEGPPPMRTVLPLVLAPEGSP